MVNFGKKKLPSRRPLAVKSWTVDGRGVEFWIVKLSQLKKKGSEILKEEVLRNGELETGFKSLEE
jgi:hypothetical protein